MATTYLPFHIASFTAIIDFMVLQVKYPVDISDVMIVLITAGIVGMAMFIVPVILTRGCWEVFKLEGELRCRLRGKSLNTWCEIRATATTAYLEARLAY
jgi:hypothetical protein